MTRGRVCSRTWKESTASVPAGQVDYVLCRQVSVWLLQIRERRKNLGQLTGVSEAGGDGLWVEWRW